MSNVVYRRCCGMDVHKDTIVVCVLPPDGVEGTPARKSYRTFRNDLSRMRGWLKLLKVTEIAMESTGVYWRPVWNILEDHGFRLLLVNPAQVKALQGRKTDRRDAKRIAEYLQDGRLDPSFVPPHEIRELRQLLRHRLSLLQQRGESHNQIRDLFETANIKLSSVASNLLGLTGRSIIEAMIAGEDSPELLAWKVKGKLRKKEKEVRESLKGCFNEFHRTMLKTHYALLSISDPAGGGVGSGDRAADAALCGTGECVGDDSGSGEDCGVAFDRGVGARHVGYSAAFRKRPLQPNGLRAPDPEKPTPGAKVRLGFVEF